MPYGFDFDLSKIYQPFFEEITRTAYRQKVCKKLSRIAQELIEKFKIQDLLGIELEECIQLLEDLIELQAQTITDRKKFLKTKRRALFLPHCARKFMDARCKAQFDSKLSSYICQHCSPDCLINQATTIGSESGYDVYILPGGSCVPKILKIHKYEGIVGVACAQELRLAYRVLKNLNIVGQAVPLIKNGCANTFFNLDSLKTIL